MFTLDDTIAALASAAGSGGRGLIRCSGPDVRSILNHRFVPHDPVSWSTCRTATRHPGIWMLNVRATEKSLRGTSFELPIDIYLWPNSRSYTGQPQAELHTYGSPPLLEALLGDLFQAGARPAQPGEFTLRAFLAGRMDLLQAEAVLGVIDAGDSRTLQTALTQLAGGVSKRLALLHTELIDLLADLEAGLDFTEEGIEFVSRDALTERISSAHDELQLLLERATSRARSTTRYRVVLAGAPNAGKSTLFNALTERSAALVSAIPGTTRDYLELPMGWRGVTWDLVDTAGLETTADPILNAALEQRETQLEQADLILYCVPATEVTGGTRSQTTASRDDFRHLESCVTDTIHQAQNEGPARHDQSPIGSSPVLVVATKSDLVRMPCNDSDPLRISVSASTGSGLDELKSKIAEQLLAGDSHETGMLGSTLARCRDSLWGATQALDRATQLALSGGGDEFLASDVREALDELGKITGAFYTDDLLDRIFSKFCIGK